MRAAGRINERFGQKVCPIKMLSSSEKCCMDFRNRLDINRWMDRESVCESKRERDTGRERERVCVCICLAQQVLASRKRCKVLLRYVDPKVAPGFGLAKFWLPPCLRCSFVLWTCFQDIHGQHHSTCDVEA